MTRMRGLRSFAKRDDSRDPRFVPLSGATGPTTLAKSFRRSGSCDGVDQVPVGVDRGSAFAKLDSLFATKPDFQWFSSPHPGRRLGAAARRDTLIPYFRRRHAKDEEFRLLAVNYSDNSRRWSNFWFDAIRRADGFNDGRWRGMLGKGAAACEHGFPQIIVLSLGRPPPRR